MKRALRILAAVLLWSIVIACVAAVIVPRFLDRIYYRGAPGAHFDGSRFFNPDGDSSAAPPGGGSRGGFLWRQLRGDDGRPPWPERATVQPAAAGELASLAPAPSGAAATPMRATWIGHASVLVQVPGLNILTDPVWSARAGPFGAGPKRVAPPGIAFDALPHVDLVLISHNHYDHLDLATLKRLWQRDRPLIVTSLGNDAILRSAGIPAHAIDWGQAVPVPAKRDAARPVRVHATRNHHWGSRWFADRNRALWSSFVVELPGGNLFFAGDTGMGDGRWPAEAAALGPIRLALVPIGAFRFRPGQMETDHHIGPVDAQEVFRRLGAWRGIAIHWGTFRLSAEGWDTPPRLLRAVQACAGGDPQRFAAVAIGRPQDVPPIGAAPPPAPVPDRAAVLACLDTPAVRSLR